MSKKIQEKTFESRAWKSILSKESEDIVFSKAIYFPDNDESDLFAVFSYEGTNLISSITLTKSLTTNDVIKNIEHEKKRFSFYEKNNPERFLIEQACMFNVFKSSTILEKVNFDTYFKTMFRKGLSFRDILAELYECDDVLYFLKNPKTPEETFVATC